MKTRKRKGYTKMEMAILLSFWTFIIILAEIGKWMAAGYVLKILGVKI